MWASGVIASDGSLMSRCIVSRSTNQGIAHATVSKVQFDIVTIDEKSEYDAVTNYRFTVQDAGLYHVDAHTMLVNLVLDDVWEIQIQVNGVKVKQNEGHGTTSIYTGMPISADLWLDTNDYVEIFVAHNGGTGIGIINDATKNWFNIARIQ